MTKPGPSVTSGADTQPGSDSLFPSGFGGGAAIRTGGVGTGEIADGSIAAVDLNLPSVAAAIAARSELTGAFAQLRPTIPAQRVPKFTLLTTWASGHGWTTLGQGTWNTNYTGDAWAGTQCAQITTDGAGGNGFIRKIGLTAVDLTSRDLVLWLKVTSNLANLRSIAYTIGSSSFASFYTGTIVDNNTLAANMNGIRQGEWFQARFCINKAGTTGTPSISSLTDFQLSVQDKAAGATTVELGGFGHYPRPSTYANGVVSFTFDDSYVSHFTNAAPALARYGWGATAYTIADQIGAGGSTMTLAQLADLQQTYGWEVAGHAYTLANHNAGFDSLSAATLDAECRNLRSWLQGNGFTVGVDHLAYPLGYQSASTDAVVAKYFRTGRLIADNPLSAQQPGMPLRIQSHLGGSADLSNSQAKVDRAKADGAWTIFTLHDIPSGTATGNQFSLANFNTLLDYIATQGVDVVPLGTVWRSNT